ncbi:efflux transporter outer membrane subunit [Paludibacterium yongneupense]|uniref:efflux transporter outer membrane subunit n=1 Tax=Paludibacterium yongneupense TaxID=400061 RepID=UPI000406960E|nr:efflux transporter outer membrane subunit [Paludibacterium yongneupense]
MALSACGSLLATPYSSPATEIPAQWAHGATRIGAAERLSDPWWRAFGDPGLNAFVDDILARNNDLAEAAITVRRAQYKAGLSDDNRYPALSASVTTSSSNHLRGDSQTTRSSSASVSVSYEADLWGKLSSANDVAQWEAKATQQDLESSAQSLVGTAVTLYWKLAYLNDYIGLQRQSIDYTRKVLAIAEAKHAAGSVSAIDVFSAQQTLAGLEADLSTLEESRVETRNSIALLYDSPQTASYREPQSLPASALPAVDAGLPAGLLARRPDLKAAELRLRESLATVDYTRASYYPDLTLTGSLGGSSTGLSRVLSDPIGTLSAELTLPFLQWTQTTLNIKVARADYDKAVISFRQTLYQALVDVDNALSARQQYAVQAERQSASLEAARKSERLYEAQYRNGYVALKGWLDAQDTRRSAEIALLKVRYNQFANHAVLCQALGGGTRLAEER